jgi:hypothetical protein
MISLRPCLLFLRLRVFANFAAKSIRLSSSRSTRNHGAVARCGYRSLGCDAFCISGSLPIGLYSRRLHANPSLERTRYSGMHPYALRTKGLILQRWNSDGRTNISPASLHRTAHSSRLRYCSARTIFPSHSVPDEFAMTTTFGTSHGPTQPLIVNWTRFNSPRFRHSLLIHSTGTSGNPRSVLPQQQPRQIVT